MKVKAAVLLWIIVVACTSVAPREESVPGERSVEKAGEEVSPAQAMAPAPAVPVSTATADDLDSAVLVYAYEDGPFFQALSPETGEPLPGYERLHAGPGAPYVAYHPHNRRLAVISHGRLYVVGVAGWQVGETDLRFPRVLDLAFDDSGERLAVAYDGTAADPRLALVDVETATALADVQVEVALRPPAGQMQWLAGGEGILLFGEAKGGAQGKQSAAVARYRAPSLENEWQLALPEVRAGTACENCLEEPGLGMSWRPGVALAPDGRSLYVVHADAERLTTVDVAAGTAKTVPLRSDTTWLEDLWRLLAPRMAAAKAINQHARDVEISPDGRFLYVVGVEVQYWETEEGLRQKERHLGLQVVEAATGCIVDRLATEATALSLLPGGEHLVLASGAPPGTDSSVVHLPDLRIVRRLPGLHLQVGRRLNGEPLLLAEGFDRGANRATLAVVHPETFNVVRRQTRYGYASWLPLKR